MRYKLALIVGFRMVILITSISILAEKKERNTFDSFKVLFNCLPIILSQVITYIETECKLGSFKNNTVMF